MFTIIPLIVRRIFEFITIEHTGNNIIAVKIIIHLEYNIISTLMTVSKSQAAMLQQ